MFTRLLTSIYTLGLQSAVTEFEDMADEKEMMDIEEFDDWQKKVEIVTSPDDEDSGTDLDINENEMDEILGRKKKDRSDCKIMYAAACKRFGVVPSSQFIHQLQGSKVHMTHLNLEDNEIKAMCIPLLYNTTVTAVDFAGNHFTVQGVRHILEMLKENVYITELGLGDNNLGLKGARWVCRMLQTHPRIKRIDLSGNKFSEYDAREFADMLRQNVVIKYLNLSHNLFGEKGGALIGAALAENISLDELDLSWNHIRLNGAIAISKSLKENEVLKRLNVAWNGFGNDGVKVLGEVLAENTSIQELDLSCNRISVEGLAYLLKGLQVNEGLTVLKLRSNPISSVGAEALLKVLKDSEQTKMVEVDIDDVPVTYNFGVLLEQLKELKKDLDVHHDCYVRNTDYLAKGKNELIADPLRLVKMYVRERSVHLVNYFVDCEEETELLLKEDQFRNAIKLASIPINDQQLDELVKDLKIKDEEGVDRGVDLSNLVNQREYRSKRRKRKLAAAAMAPDETEAGKQLDLSDGELSEASDLAEEVDIILADGGRASSVADDVSHVENDDILNKSKSSARNSKSRAEIVSRNGAISGRKSRSGDANARESKSGGSARNRKSGDPSTRDSKAGDVGGRNSTSGDASARESKDGNTCGRDSKLDDVSGQISKAGDVSGRNSKIDDIGARNSANKDMFDAAEEKKSNSKQERSLEEEDKAFPLTEPEPTMASIVPDD
ncbi:leucine-rich repeat-containing protein 74A-like isoform X2 [Lineus longissimus]|uniref:leucine-rich repeat-containing protein 74A-like isoform X2 n=1 Tax=Lineus longissimus TaxID=88925 RepID=UPI00315DE5DC